MSVPTSVSQLLEMQRVTYAVSESRGQQQYSITGQPHEQYLRHAGAVKSLILHDVDGWVQVLVGAGSLFDIHAANQLLERNMRPLSGAKLQEFYDRHHYTSTPALPKLGGMATLIDQRLLDQPVLLLDSGAAGLLEMTQADFALMVPGTVVGDISEPVAALEARLNAVRDVEVELLTAVKNFTTRRIRQRLEDTLELPALPETAERIIQLRVDPNADVSDLAQIVERDPSLAAQVVSWAASPYYSAPGKIKSIQDAIVRVLGFDMVLNLALGLALGKTVSLPKDGPHGATSYWRQAVYTAAAMESLVTAIPRDQRPSFGLAYLSGLLHNFGWLVLSEVFPPQFSRICRSLEANTHLPSSLVEFHILGVTREHIASWLMELWGMPDEVVTALRCQYQSQHQSQTQTDHREYARLLFLAQQLLQQRGIGQGTLLGVPDEVFASLHLDPQKAEQALDTVMESAADLDNIAQYM